MVNEVCHLPMNGPGIRKFSEVCPQSLVCEELKAGVKSWAFVQAKDGACVRARIRLGGRIEKDQAAGFLKGFASGNALVKGLITRAACV